MSCAHTARRSSTVSVVPFAAWLRGAALAQPIGQGGRPDGALGVGPGISPIVTFDPDRGMISRPPTRRALTAAELKLARERADRRREAVKSSPSFANPRGPATCLTSWAVIDEQGMFSQD
jgi:hypothetical protein